MAVRAANGTRDDDDAARRTHVGSLAAGWPLVTGWRLVESAGFDERDVPASLATLREYVELQHPPRPEPVALEIDSFAAPWFATVHPFAMDEGRVEMKELEPVGPIISIDPEIRVIDERGRSSACRRASVDRARSPADT